MYQSKVSIMLDLNDNFILHGHEDDLLLLIGNALTVIQERNEWRGVKYTVMEDPYRKDTPEARILWGFHELTPSESVELIIKSVGHCVTHSP